MVKKVLEAGWDLGETGERSFAKRTEGKGAQGGEQTKEQKIQAKIKEEAVRDSENYFKLQQQRLEKLLNDKTFQQQMEGLLNRMSEGSEVSDEELKTAFGEGADDDTVILLRKSLEFCKPINSLGKSYEKLSMALRENFSAVTRTMSAELNFDSPKSWYKNNPSGIATLERITARVR